MLHKLTNTTGPLDKLIVGIHSFAKYLPDNKIHVSQWAEEFRKNQEFIQRMTKEHGLKYYYRANQNDSIIHMCSEAVQRIMERKDISPEKIDLVLLFHTVQTSIPLPPKSVTTAIISNFNMINAVGFSLAQQNCVSFIASLQIIKHIMSCRPNIKNVIVIGADKAPSESQRNIEGYQMESDAAVAALVRRDCNRHRILNTGVVVDGKHYRGFQISDTQTSADASMRTAYLTLYKLVKNTIKDYIELDKITKILPHNVNPAGLRQIERSLRVTNGMMFMDNISDKGHMYGCDGIINLIDCEGKHIHPEDYYIIISIGYGRAYGCALMQA